MNPEVRKAAVAGMFYPDSPEELARTVTTATPPAAEKVRALACMVPHAGYIFSGAVAGAVFARLQLPECFVILCPNHTGQGQPLAIMSRGKWETPLGLVPVDAALATALLRACPHLQEDAAAHRREHAIEVQLPFLQLAAPGFSFVPIALGTSHFEVLHGLGEALAEVLKREQRSVLILASSDMNHYESDEVTRLKDRAALEPILALDAQGLYDVVFRKRISMCGFGPAVATLTAARSLGAASAQLVRYATSAEVSGDCERVVGYAGVIIA